MQTTYENHQFYSPVTNWKSKNKNRRRQQILSVNTQKKKVIQNEEESPKFPKSPNGPKSAEVPKSPNEDLVFPSRSQSLNSKFPKKISPKATSKPINIPSYKKVPQIAVSDSVKTEIGISNNSHRDHSIHKSVVTSPNSSNTSFSNTSFTNNHSFKKSGSNALPIPKRSESSLNPSSMKNKNFRGKNVVNVPKINTANLSNISNSLDSCTLIDSANSESSSYLHFRKNVRSPRMHTPVNPELSNSCHSPALSSNNSNIIDHESSIATLIQSPTSTDTSFLNMSSDQLFKLLPKKIIKATENYTAQNEATEISYKKGDFFFVVSEDDTYYFVTNPSTKQSGYVSKYSFEQVDNFTKPIKVKGNFNLSPIAERDLGNDDKEKDMSDIDKEQSSINDRVMTACITEDIISRNSQQKFPIEITKIDGTVAVLKRSYNDLCKLHNLLLDFFPEDAGSNDEERILPFLPSLDAIFNHPNKSPRQILNNYLQILTKLPNYIQFSYPFEKFFSLRQDDILSSIYVVSQLNFFEDSRNSRMFNETPSSIKVKIIAEDEKSGRQEINILRIDPEIEYFDLFDMIEDRFDRTFSNIYYKNENGLKIKIFGDHDLRLFFNSNNLSYVLWAK
eukprot:jgi/Orpsp1_1/1187161/evm.model.d7180000055863.1